MGGYTVIQCPNCKQVISEGYPGDSMHDTPCDCPSPLDECRAELERVRDMSERRRQALNQQARLNRTCERVRNKAFAEVDALRAQVEREWQPIETAPKDGTLIDVWCIPPEGSDFEPINWGIRLTNVSWGEADEKVGWLRICDDGQWDFLEDGPCEGVCGLPPWVPTHWMPLPSGPDAALRGEE